MMTIEEAINLGLMHHQAGRVGEAEQIYRQVLGVAPGHAGAWMLLGVARLQGGNHAEAIELLRRSIALTPMAAAYSNLGEALRLSDRFEEAVTAYREAIGLEPVLAAGYSNLGLVLQTLRRFDESEQVLRKAVELEPANAAAWQNLCNTLGDVGKVEEAVVAGLRAVELSGGSPGAWSDLGVACVEAGKLAEAKEAFERGIKVEPKRADLHHNLAQVLLRTGEFERGWEEYEWRWRCRDFPSPQRGFVQPLWRGEDLRGKTILLHAEQGLGDAIMFARYIPLVVERMAGRVIVECQGEILELIRTASDGAEYVSRGEALPEFDVQCPFLSLPRATGVKPDHVPYLWADKERVQAWRENLQENSLGQKKELRVGIVWAGRATHRNDHNRSVWAEWFARLAMDGAALYSLQVGEAAGQVKDVPGAVDLSRMLVDYSETAAALECLDLVISVDTSVVHAAGALGKEVWMVLPFAGDWRWIAGREDSSWYPTMRLFRQEKWGDWEGVFERVKVQLVKRLKLKAS